MTTQKSPFVQTVLGPIAPSELGSTLMHEHLVQDWPYALGLDERSDQSLPVIKRVLECLERAAEAGVEGMVDVGANIFGPNPLLLYAVAVQCRQHIIASTGCFAANMLPPPSWAYPPAGPEDIAKRFITDATVGLDKSGLKPGIIKIATSGEAIAELEENVFKAAALAQRETGLGIITHTYLTRFPEEQVEILAEAGADLDRVVIGHFGWGLGAEARDLHLRVAERGVTLGFDSVGTPARSDEEYVQMVVDMVEAGYEKQIILSHDGVAYSRGLGEIWDHGWMSGDWGIVHRRLVPKLRERGISDETLHEILVENPRRILTIDPQRYEGAANTLLKELTIEPIAPFDYGAAT